MVVAPLLPYSRAIRLRLPLAAGCISVATAPRTVAASHATSITT